jgi:hypothetical protein
VFCWGGDISCFVGVGGSDFALWKPSGGGRQVMDAARCFTGEGGGNSKGKADLSIPGPGRLDFLIESGTPESGGEVNCPPKLKRVGIGAENFNSKDGGAADTLGRCAGRVAGPVGSFLRCEG